MILLTLPEPVSKGIAAVLTVALISWVGFDTFWSLIVGFKQLVEDADRATTFDELRRAGERYGKVMGRNAARAFAMLATAAIGSTAAGLANKLPTLPGEPQAAELAGTQLRVRLSGWKDIRKMFRRACRAAVLSGLWFHDNHRSFCTTLAVGRCRSRS